MFEHQTGRMVALGRLVLALIFFAAVWFDPYQPARDRVLGALALGAYIGFAGAMLAVSWRDWWHEFRLARPAFVVDALVFLLAVHFTEGPNSDFISPYVAFYAFLVLTAMVRWGWRIAAAAAVAVAAMYLIAGLVVQSYVAEPHLYRLGRRIAYMLFLALLIIWFGLHRNAMRVASCEIGAGENVGGALAAAMDYAMRQTGARGAAIAWFEADEPWVELRGAGTLGRDHVREGPGLLGGEGSSGVDLAIFDERRGRALELGADRVVVARRGPVHDPVPARFGVDIGMCVPISSLAGSGKLLLVDFEGLCADHLELGRAIGHEIGAALDRRRVATLEREAAVAGTRNALARDLHDSVAQSLAGACLRLEGLRTDMHRGTASAEEVASIQAALRAEQREVRHMIDGLRRTDRVAETEDLVAQLGTVLNDAANHWTIEAKFVAGETECIVPRAMAREVRFIVHEGVANAVRHGHAKRIVATIDRQDGELQLTVTDNGEGWPKTAQHALPRSIYDRVSALGGTLSVASKAGATCLKIRLPLQVAA